MICSAVSRGALSWGQCPVASSVTSTLPGMCSLHVRPHLGRGDHVLSALQHQRRDRDLREVGAVVGQEGGAGEHLGDVPGPCWQKLLVNSSPSSGRSGLPMITGAMVADQPR